MNKKLAAVVLVAVFTVVSVTFAYAASVEAQIPFRGTIEGVENHVINFPIMQLDGSGTGVATALGHCSF